jgi:myo-inositol-1(or 4)-monophosphatase
MDMNYDLYFQVAKRAILAPQEFILKNFGKDLEPEIVDDHDLKIPVDKKAEKVMIDIIKEEFPEHGFDSEEFGKDGSEKEFVWYIDPLDGTNNYVPGIPYFGSSIALIHKNECIISIIHNPFLNKTYHAIKGFGAYLNGEKLVCQNKKK